MALVLAVGCGDDDGTTPGTDAGRVDSGGGGSDSGPPRDTGMGGADTGMGGGMCTTTPDMTAISRMDYGMMMNQDYGDIVTDCAVGCFLGGKMGEMFLTCARECVDMDTMMSATNGCRDCFIARAGCAAMNCAAQCIDGGADCDMCQCDNNCVQDFDTCSGLMTSMCM